MLCLSDTVHLLSMFFQRADVHSLATNIAFPLFAAVLSSEVHALDVPFEHARPRERLLAEVTRLTAIFCVPVMLPLHVNVE